MVTLHIYLMVSPDKKEEFSRLYWNEYVPAISKQEGFINTSY
jgi:hypothetical protein